MVCEKRIMKNEIYNYDDANLCDLLQEMQEDENDDETTMERILEQRRIDREDICNLFRIPYDEGIECMVDEEFDEFIDIIMNGTKQDIIKYYNDYGDTYSEIILNISNDELNNMRTIYLNNYRN